MLIPAELWAAAPKDARWWMAVLPAPAADVYDDGYLYDEDDEETD